MADLDSIYSRLNAGSQYTPLSAETFGDWSIEAGDLVTLRKDGNDYQTPVMCSSLKWNGAPMVTIESEGNTERESLSKMSKRAYNSSSGGGGSGGYYRSVGGMRRIADAEEAIVLERHTREEQDEAFYKSSITVAKDYVDIESTARKKGESDLRGEIKVEADKITQIVEAVGADGKVTAASIVASVNKAGSSVVISADHIQLEGNTFISKLTAAISKISLLKAIGISATNISASGYVEASDIRLKGGHKLAETFIGAQINSAGNGYEIRFLKADGSWYSNVLSFSRAVTSWGVTASGGVIRVTAQPQDQHKPVYVGISGTRSITANGTYTFNVIYASDASSDGANTGATAQVTVNVPTESYSNSARLTYTGSEKVGALTRYNYYSSDLITSSNRIVYW